MNTDLASNAPETFARQPKAILEPVELNIECAFGGYHWRLAPQVEMRMLDVNPPIPLQAT